MKVLRKYLIELAIFIIVAIIAWNIFTSKLNFLSNNIQTYKDKIKQINQEKDKIAKQMLRLEKENKLLDIKLRGLNAKFRSIEKSDNFDDAIKSFTGN